MQIHIGLDDTDSTNGGCTTYVAAQLVEKLTKMNVTYTDYPNIIRLNPNIPYKTRGNAAVALRAEMPERLYDSVCDLVLEEVERQSDIGEKGTDPAVVFLKGRPTPSIMKVARRALYDVVPVSDALAAIQNSNAEGVTYGTRIGLVGAVAAIGNTLTGDHTFELVAYRKPRNCGTLRRIDKESVKRMNSLTIPLTYNNYDEASKRVLIAPHGPDPVLLGIRGESPEILRKAFNLLIIREPIERWVIFRTNHATDAHLEIAKQGQVRQNSPAVLSGIVVEKPRRITGGHVLFPIRTNHGQFMCAAFEPTGRFRNVVGQLIPGDHVTAFGGISGIHGLTVNLEKLSIQNLIDSVVLQNPRCPNCGKRLKSAGRGKGYKCNRCSTAIAGKAKIRIIKERKIKPGLYLPGLKAHRHLTKPLSRYGRERVWDRKPPSTAEWHNP